ncbi:chromate efflux transporter [Parvibium lacunae]|nr:chromate efflux transporter [Parvibium lacunae]
MTNSNDRPPTSHDADRLKIPFWEAFSFWLKLGFVSFGGPAGQIAIMHRELVERRRWISEGRFLHALNYCMVLPGPEAQQLATYIGWLMHRTAGGVVAGLLFILPSLLILIALSWLYMAYGHTDWLTGIFNGIKPAVTAIVLHAAYRIGGRTLKNKWLWSIATASFIAIFIFNTPFPLIIAVSALAGWLGGHFAPTQFSMATAHGNGKHGDSPAVIDDHTPTPAHAQFRWVRLLSMLAIGLLLWAVPLTTLTYAHTWQSTLPQMAWFFSKAALLTFGGAYAVLPYVYQGAVGHYGWLTAPQMIDGLALGETTPGPLIMVVTFVGFVGGYQHPALAANLHTSPLWAGVLAACVVTWFTFLPSFIFIFAGGPLIESTHRKLAYTAPLTAITAAVVGVIVNLACFFAYHVIWPTGLAHPPSWVSLLIMAGAALALFRYQINVLPVILLCGAAGWLFSLVG